MEKEERDREVSRGPDVIGRGENEKGAANFTIPTLTTPRTTAFIPALSPPEVSTAIFILVLLGLVEEEEDGRR